MSADRANWLNHPGARIAAGFLGIAAVGAVIANHPWSHIPEGFPFSSSTSSGATPEMNNISTAQASYEKAEIDMIIKNPKLQSWWQRMKEMGYGVEVNYWPGHVRYLERDFDNFTYIEVVDWAGVNERTEPSTENDNNILGAYPPTFTFPSILTLHAYGKNGRSVEAWALDGLGRLVVDFDRQQQYIDGKWMAITYGGTNYMHYKITTNTHHTYVWTGLNTAVRAPEG